MFFEYILIRKKVLEFGGSLFDVSFWKIVMVMRMVMYRDIFLLYFGGNIKVKKIM